MAPATKPQCPLCRRQGKLTDEDVMPLWLRRAILAQWGEELAERKQLPPKMILRVCLTCNQLMARRFEAPSAPLIKPLVQAAPSRLTPRDRVLIARWFIKTGLLLDLRQETRPRMQDFLRFLLAHLLFGDGNPPPGTSIRVGACDVILDRPTLVPYTAVDEHPGDVSYLLEGHPLPTTVLGTVGNFGRLAFEVQLGVPGQGVESFVQSVQRNDALLRIWPPNVGGDVDWPPGRTLRQDELRDLKAAWAVSRGGSTAIDAAESWRTNTWSKARL